MTDVRILYLVPNLFGSPGGIARHGRLVCQALRDARTELWVLALNDAPGEVHAAEASCLGIEYRTYGGNRGAFVRDAVRHSTRHPSLVMVEHPNFSHLGWLCARLAGARYVVFGHGIDIWNPLDRSRRWALRRADRIICVSRFTAERAVQANELRSESMRILYNCLDPRFERTVKPASHQQSLSLLTVSRLALADQYKGHQLIIGALPDLLDRFPKVTYHVIGDGDLRPSLEALTVQLGVERAVYFHGVVSDSELAQHYADASVFVMPSRSEGFGFAFLEAMAAGTPAIGGALDAAPEVIIDGETGYIVDPTSVDGVRSRIALLLADESLRLRMGQAAREHVARMFGFDQFKSRLLGQLDELAPLPRGKSA